MMIVTQDKITEYFGLVGLNLALGLLEARVSNLRSGTVNGGRSGRTNSAKPYILIERYYWRRWKGGSSGEDCQAVKR